MVTLSICIFLFVFGFPFILPFFADVVLSSDEDGKDQENGCIPPSYPYRFPILGHALAFAYDAPGMFTRVGRPSKRFPFKLHLVIMNLHLLSDFRDILGLLSQSQSISNKIYRDVAVGTMFGMPKKAREFIASDDSGLSHRPHPESTRVGHHRIDFLTHVSLGKFIQGPGLKPLSTRFAQNALELFSRFDLSREWVEMPDLFTLVQKIIFQASVPAMFGKHLLGRNPSFFDDFCNFDVGVPNLAKRLPRWIIPSAYNARDKCLETIKRHHCFLKQECGDLKPDGNVLGYSDVYGAEIIRYRHDMWSKMEAMDSNAKAAEDLGMIWGANSNSSHVAFWLIYFINRDAQVLAKTREALHEACSAANAPGEISIDELCASPYLSALYAETLRLRSASIVMRKPERRDLRIGRWLIPKGDVVGFSGWTTHFDETLWNTGTPSEPHGLHEFWPERFLVSTHARYHGPTKPGHTKTSSQEPLISNRRMHASHSEQEAISSGKTAGAVGAEKATDLSCEHGFPIPNEPQNSSVSEQVSFSTEALQGIFVPYGGGQNICPGRYYAKQEIWLTVAILMLKFDVELHGPETMESYQFFATGVLSPQGPTPFKLRRRS